MTVNVNTFHLLMKWPYNHANLSFLKFGDPVWIENILFLVESIPFDTFSTCDLSPNKHTTGVSGITAPSQTHLQPGMVWPIQYLTLPLFYISSINHHSSVSFYEDGSW